MFAIGLLRAVFTHQEHGANDIHVGIHVVLDYIYNIFYNHFVGKCVMPGEFWWTLREKWPLLFLQNVTQLVQMDVIGQKQHFREYGSHLGKNT